MTNEEDLKKAIKCLEDTIEIYRDNLSMAEAEIELLVNRYNNYVFKDYELQHKKLIYRWGTLSIISILLGFGALFLSNEARADLPITPTFRLTPQDPTNTVPIRQFIPFCATGLDNTANSSTFTQLDFFTTTVYMLPGGTLANGDWTCYVDVVTDEATPRWAPTNRVSFTINAPAGPVPPHVLTVE